MAVYFLGETRTVTSLQAAGFGCAIGAVVNLVIYAITNNGNYLAGSFFADLLALTFLRIGRNHERHQG